MNKPLKNTSTAQCGIKNAGPFICFVATSTNEKLEHYNAIARANNVPILYLSLNTILAAYHAAPEDTGSRVENSLQKTRAIKDKVSEFQTNPAYQKLIKEVCADYALSFIPNNILFMGEDSTLEVPKEVWDILRKKHVPLVPEEVLNSADNHGKNAGPGAETGPIIAAVSIENFVNWIRTSALESGYKPKDIIELIDQVAASFYRLGTAVEAGPTKLDLSVPLHLATNGNLKKPFLLDPSQINLTAEFLSAPAFNGTPNIKKFEEFLTGHSVRRALVMTMYEHLTGLPADAPRAPISLKRQKVDIGSFRVYEAKKPPVPRLLPKNAPPRARMIQAINPLAAYEKADARIFYPLTGLSPREQLQMGFQLLATATVRDFEAAEMSKPLIVLDDGSWTQKLDLLTYLANMGMAKRYVRQPFFDRKPLKLNAKCEHLAFSDMHIVRGKKLGDMEAAAKEILAHSLRDYRHFNAHHTLNTQCNQGGIDPVQNLLTLAAFTSASNDNLVNLTFLRELANYAAQNGHAISSGGGDKHAMGAYHMTYRQANGVHSICTSTPPLVASETENSEIPPCDSWSLVSDLYTRTVDIVHPCHAVVCAAGGKGSAVEQTAVHLLHALVPDLMQQTHMIYWNGDIHQPQGRGPNAFHEPFMRAFLGDREADKLLNTAHDGRKQKGFVHAAATVGGAISIIEQIHATLPKPLTHFRLG
ncbi:MAG: hypothetical protein PHW63_00310 [Alphaproteobacteria bacterium]|nr:hypothetical protein [Alphaproteobacteria bacterium]